MAMAVGRNIRLGYGAWILSGCPLSIVHGRDAVDNPKRQVTRTVASPWPPSTCSMSPCLSALCWQRMSRQLAVRAPHPSRPSGYLLRFSDPEYHLILSSALMPTLHTWTRSLSKFCAPLFTFPDLSVLPFRFTDRVPVFLCPLDSSLLLIPFALMPLVLCP